MLTPQRIDTIRRLLQERRLTYSAIASLMGVHRNTVLAISQDKLGNQRRLAAQANAQQALEKKLQDPKFRPQRCPECGNFVYLPCRVCDVRRRVASDRLPRRPPPARDRPLNLQLRPAQRERYEQVRAHREAFYEQKPGKLAIQFRRLPLLTLQDLEALT